MTLATFTKKSKFFHFSTMRFLAVVQCKVPMKLLP